MKQITPQQLSGKEGVHLFAARVLRAGLSFHETGALDAGIDGFIELRDPVTNEVRAQFIAAQLKTIQTLAEDTGETFAYRGTERDVDYWFQSNAPVILVVVHPPTGRIWWKSVQTYFEDPERRRQRKVVFDQAADLLAEDAVPRFVDLVAGFAKPGLVTPSSRVEERLETNLLWVAHPETVNVAPTELSFSEIRQAMLRHQEYPPRDWIVHGGRIVTFRDLDDPLFEEVCDPGAADGIGTREWYGSDGDVTERQFVHLLGRCLWERTQERLVFNRPHRYHYFKADFRRGIERTIEYRSYQNNTQRKVVSAHGRSKQGGGPAYYRHTAFVPRFVRLGDAWYLAIDPTYHFTRDGWEEHPFGADRLATIKRFETNSNVRGHIGMWRAVLTDPGDLLQPDYPFLRFETVPSLMHPYGVPDDLWMRREDPEARKTQETNRDELLL